MKTRRAGKREKLLRGALIGAGAGLLTLVLHLLGALQQLEWKAWDMRLRLWSRPDHADSRIVIFLIDQYSLDVYEKEQGLSWPWPRQLYSAIIDYLRLGGARAVFFDLDFSASSRSGLEDDEEFARAMARAGNVFLPVALSRVEESYVETPASRLERFSLPASLFSAQEYRRFPEAIAAGLPVSPLLEACRGLGNVVFPPDADGVFRRLPLAFSYRGLLIPSAPLALARFLAEDKPLPPVPLDKEGRMVLRYHGPTGTYRSYSVAAIINSYAQLEEGLEPQLPPREFAGKIVLVGGSAAGLLDLRPTPFSPVSPGVDIQAVALDNLLHGDAFHPPSVIRLICFLFLLTVFTALAATLLARVWLQVLLFFVALALPFGLSWLAFRSGMWFELVTPELGVVSSFLAASLLNYAIEGKQRRFIKTVFSHYLSPEVIDRIVADPSLLRLGGEKRVVTSFFSDVAGFTAIAERLSPEALVHFLNEYLSEMTEIILGTGGTLDKYEGDAIIAFWNAPLDQPDHALRACRAALRCQERLAELDPHFKAAIGKSVTMRIGLNSGPAVVGNMGSGRRFDYTAMGDTINLASRLEGACKLYQVGILAGEETYLRVRESILACEVDTIRVIGRDRPVRVYEIVAEKDRATEKAKERVQLFEEAMGFYRRRDWGEAIARLERLPVDPLARLYVERCHSLRQNPPPEDWDGVYTLKHK